MEGMENRDVWREEAMARGVPLPASYQPRPDPCRVLQLFLSRTAQRGHPT